MAVTSKWYGQALANMLDGTANAVWDWSSDDIRTSLHTSTYTPNQDTHDFFNDTSNQLASGSGYSTGGYDHATLTVSYNAASGQARVDADDAVWSSASFTARYAVTHKYNATAANAPLIIYTDFGGDQTVSSGTFTIQWDSTGVGYIDVT